MAISYILDVIAGTHNTYSMAKQYHFKTNKADCSEFGVTALPT